MRAFSKEKAIDLWDTVEVPETAPRMTIRRGDVLVCDGKARGSIALISLSMPSGYSLNAAVNSSRQPVLFLPRHSRLRRSGARASGSCRRDCLGLCWLSFLAQRAADVQME